MRKYAVPLIMLIVFETVAVVLWQTKDNLFYVEDNHEAIIPKELFMKVQEEMVRRGSLRDCKGRQRGFSSKHCFSGMIYCGKCGEIFRRIHWNNRGTKSIVWRCIMRLPSEMMSDLMLSFSKNGDLPMS